MEQKEKPFDKLAQTVYPVHELIRKRWSARSFSGAPVSLEKLYTMFEAATWAASSMNEQPWRYMYALKENEAEFKKFHSCLLPGNKPWSSSASILILSLAKKTFAKTMAANKHYFHDVGAANNNLLLQAASMDIYGRMMAGFDVKKTISLFNLPEDLEPVCFIALGYLDHPEKLEEPYLTREKQQRSRKRLEEIILN